MKCFIKLSSVVINTSKISKIVLNPKNYEIHLAHHNLDSFFFVGNGFIETKPNIILVEKCSEDYDFITKFIEGPDVLSI
jgi:hypothetical protein